MNRRFMRAATAALMALAAAAPAPAHAGTLTVVLEEVPCPDAGAIAHAVELDLAGGAAATPDLALLVRPADAGTLALRLVGLGSARTRTIPFRARDCAALRGALELVVSSWLSHRLLESSVMGLDVSTQPDLRLRGTPETAPPAELPPEGPPPGRRAAALALLSGGHYSAGQASPWLQASLLASVAPSRTWGAGLMASYRGAVLSRESWGTLRADSGMLAALGMAQLGPAEGLRVLFFAGPALEVLRAQASGLATMHSATGTTLAAFGSVQLRGALADRLGWVAAVDAVLRQQSRELALDGGPVGRIGAFGAGAQVGISWDAL